MHRVDCMGLNARTRERGVAFKIVLVICGVLVNLKHCFVWSARGDRRAAMGTESEAHRRQQRRQCAEDRLTLKRAWAEKATIVMDLITALCCITTSLRSSAVLHTHGTNT